MPCNWTSCGGSYITALGSQLRLINRSCDLQTQRQCFLLQCCKIGIFRIPKLLLCKMWFPFAISICAISKFQTQLQRGQTDNSMIVVGLELAVMWCHQCPRTTRFLNVKLMSRWEAGEQKDRVQGLTTSGGGGKRCGTNVEHVRMYVSSIHPLLVCRETRCPPVFTKKKKKKP